MAGRQVADVLMLLGGMAESEDEHGVAPGTVRAAVAGQLPLLLPLLDAAEPEVRRTAAWAVSHTRFDRARAPRPPQALGGGGRAAGARGDPVRDLPARPAGRLGGGRHRPGPVPAGRDTHGRRLRLPRCGPALDRGASHDDAVPSADRIARRRLPRPRSQRAVHGRRGGPAEQGPPRGPGSGVHAGRRSPARRQGRRYGPTPCGRPTAPACSPAARHGVCWPACARRPSTRRPWSRWRRCWAVWAPPPQRPRTSWPRSPAGTRTRQMTTRTVHWPRSSLSRPPRPRPSWQTGSDDGRGRSTPLPGSGVRRTSPSRTTANSSARSGAASSGPRL